MRSELGRTRPARGGGRVLRRIFVGSPHGSPAPLTGTPLRGESGPTTRRSPHGRTPFLKRGFEVCDLRRNCPPPPCGGGRTIPSASLTGLPPPVGGRDANLATSAAGEAQALRTREGCDLRTEADP